METVVGGDTRHGTVVATLTNGTRLLGCRCMRVVHEGRWRSHIAQHRREHVVWRSSMEVNASPRDTGYERLDPAASRAINEMRAMEQPKVRRTRGPRK